MSDPNSAQSLSESLRSAEVSGPDAQRSASDTVAAMAQARDVGELERIRRAVQAAGEAAYHWDVATDRLLWNSDAAALLKIGDPASLDTGRGFADLLDADNAANRFEVIMRSKQTDTGSGVPYCVEYSMRPLGRQSVTSIWVEDSGRWFAGKDGKPAEAAGLIRPINDRHERDERLEFLSNCDPLTGMMNRGRIADELAGAIVRSQDNGTSCGFLIAIINNLAVVNDAYGFDIADEVIVSVGHRLQRVVRQDDRIARYSGAKYAILLNDCSEDELQLAAERFLRVARDSVIETEMGPVWAMLSIGGIYLPKHADSANAAMASAEEALAEAKRQNSDCFVAFEPSAERVSVRDLNARCAAEIVSGLREERFALAFQPIVSAATGEAVMHEALLRMKCDDSDDVIAATHLIPIAEKLGLVRLIDQAVVNLVIQALTGFEQAHISINVSGTTAADPRWFIQLTEALSEHPEVASRIVIEITEAAVLNDLDDAAAFVNRLRELGCKVAIDDFGAGFTSFRNLKVLNVDMVKIDGSYCENLSENHENQYFVRSLIDLAKKFKLKVVAEWVQNELDAQLLSEMGVDYLQGNHCGEPLMIEPWVASAEVDDASAPSAGESSDTQLDSCQPEVPDQPANDAGAFSVDVTAGADVVKTALSNDALDEEIFVPVAAQDNTHSSLPQAGQLEEPFVPLPAEPEGDSAAAQSVNEQCEESSAPDVLPGADVADDAEIFGTGLDLSRLKNAMSALDANFATGADKAADPESDTKAEQSDDAPQPDMAKAIATAYGSGSQSSE